MDLKPTYFKAFQYYKIIIKIIFKQVKVSNLKSILQLVKLKWFGWWFKTIVEYLIQFDV